MSLFKKTIASSELPAITAEQAQTIYNRFKEGENETIQFTKYGEEMEYAVQVKTEMEKLEQEVGSKMSGSYEGFEVSTKQSLIDSLSSDLLNIETLIDDIVNYYGTYDESRTFTQYKASFN